mmetsp:Transcript_10997/g.44291  ORF Transcript_10997/g.44291 Transcript_10997/m.44291 type:complete len:687 (+) Transcript_10997:14-2074(+)
MAAPTAASVAPLVNTAPRLLARRGAIVRPVARGHAVRASVVGTGGENASELESTTRRGTPLPLPSHFDLDTAVLLGGFAFESYSTPEGGVVDADVNGSSTAYLSDFVREVYSGVLEVTMVRGENLPRGDKLGLSDPYCVVSVGGGGSSARTKTKRFTLDPKWDDEAPMRLLVRRRDASGERRNQTLTVRVLDEDAGKSDDLLGVARLPLADLIDGSLVKIPLTGEIGLAREEEVTAELTSEGGGIGGGKIVARLRFVPFNPRADEVVGEGLRRAARIMERKGERDGSDSMKLAAKAAGAVAGGLAFVTTELSRGEREDGLWAVRPDGDWATLATEKRLRVRGKDASPHDFEKVCFVESVRTDTQAAVWRCAADKTVVISFRGTEMSKPLDVLTDVNLAPAAFSPERVEVEGEDEPMVHGGFLAAYDSVKRRILRAVDDVIGAGSGSGKVDSADEGERALRSNGGNDDRWHVFVTGHSLGGALCTLLAADLGASVKSGSRNFTVTAINFGSPRVGNRAFVATYNDLVPDSVRVVNGDDLVPTLPALLGYRHVDHGVRIDADGGLAGCSDKSISDKSSSDVESRTATGLRSETREDGGWAGRAALVAAMRGDVTAAAESVREEIQTKGAAKIVELADALGVGSSLGVDEETAADAANALATLVSASAVGDHFEDKYYAALRDAAGRRV